jgi:carbamoyl-phosphate synthase large subunit
MTNRKKNNVMIAGIGGASLGSELQKCISACKKNVVFGCDISPEAYGHFLNGFEKTYVVDKSQYVENVIEVCLETNTTFLIPGGEEPMFLLGEAIKTLASNGITLLGNSRKIISLFSNKCDTFNTLASLGLVIPKTQVVNSKKNIEYVGIPCIIKPSTDSGGSTNVFFATSVDEALMYSKYIQMGGGTALAQEYISNDEGEFTIGVLSLPTKKVVGAIALKRSLKSKLSLSYNSRGGVISSGYSQGYIGQFDSLCSQACTIAKKIESEGPINIQGRVRDGILIPFEINPRFSASTYLRAMAGFNEVQMLIDYYNTGEEPKNPKITYGWYLRSLTEQYVESIGRTDG